MKSTSIKDVARIAGTSIATVSRYHNNPDSLSPELRERVAAAVEETGYAPNSSARALRKGKTKILMVVVPSVGIPFFGRVMQGIQKAARAAGYTVVIEETQYGEITEDIIGSVLVSRQIDGLILLASSSPFGTRIFSERSQQRIPIIIGCENISTDSQSLPCVCIDNLAAARDATNYLISQGHKKIAVIRGSDRLILTKDREYGYRQAMQDAGIAIRDDWIVDGDLTIAGAQRATRRLLSCEDRPTAIFCLNDEMALACLAELRDAGLAVPEDMSVLGFDDIPFSSISSPPLSTVAQPAEEIGERVVNKLFRRMDGLNVDMNETEIVSHSLIIRESVGKLR